MPSHFTPDSFSPDWVDLIRSGKFHHLRQTITRDEACPSQDPNSFPDQEEIDQLPLHVDACNTDQDGLPQHEFLTAHRGKPHAMPFHPPVSRWKVIPPDESTLQDVRGLYHEADLTHVGNNPVENRGLLPGRTMMQPLQHLDPVRLVLGTRTYAFGR